MIWGGVGLIERPSLTTANDHSVGKEGRWRVITVLVEVWFVCVVTLLIVWMMVMMVMMMMMILNDW